MSHRSLQERFAPAGRCFGCGPANAEGLRIRSFPAAELSGGEESGGQELPGSGDEVVAEWTPAPHHEAFEGVLNGGIIGTLLDCHSNWTAAWHLMRRDGVERPPTTVTAGYHVKLRRPTPSGRPVRLSARAVASDGPKVTVHASLSAAGEVTATCEGTFVAVPPGHPAYGRW